MIETLVTWLPVLVILWPLVLLGISLLPGTDNRFTPWLVTAPVPAILAALFSGGGFLSLSPSAAMPFMLAIDAPGAVLLGVSAFLWAAAAAGLPGKLAGSNHRRRFTVCWILTLTGNLGIFLAADVMGFFVFYALASLPAYGLVIHEESAAAKKAGVVYLGFALLGEALLLMGLVLLVLNPSGGGFEISNAVATLEKSPWMVPTLVLLIVAFALKIGLVPAHGWLPLAHTVAPSPASAVLSGAILNAGVLGLIRFVPFGVELSGGIWLVVLGFSGAIFGVVAGLSRSHPKAVLAYSSVSQMGFIAAVSGMAMISGNAAVVLPLAFYAAHHTLVKGGLFLSAGWAESGGSGRVVWWMAMVLLVGLGLGGLPLTGGWLAKLAVKEFFSSGVTFWLATASSAATSALMMSFGFRLLQKRRASPDNGSNPALCAAWLLMVVAAVAVPWGLCSALPGFDWEKSLSASELWKAAWPVVLGAALGGWIGWRTRPQDIAGNRFTKAAGDWITGVVRDTGTSIQSGEAFVRRWNVSGACLVFLVVAIAVLLLYFMP
jgi:formate hydrogenlyase subunit 3/multisubunit Na+/H+ antiporter MnhD subunit